MFNKYVYISLSHFFLFIFITLISFLILFSGSGHFSRYTIISKVVGKMTIIHIFDFNNYSRSKCYLRLIRKQKNIKNNIKKQKTVSVQQYIGCINPRICNKISIGVIQVSVINPPSPHCVCIPMLPVSRWDR